MNTYKNSKKNLVKPGWYGMKSGSEKGEDQRKVSQFFDIGLHVWVTYSL